jgi:hypothetical protein
MEGKMLLNILMEMGRDYGKNKEKQREATLQV